jgi:hypothetical protein
LSKHIAHSLFSQRWAIVLDSPSKWHSEKAPGHARRSGLAEFLKRNLQARLRVVFQKRFFICAANWPRDFSALSVPIHEIRG